MNAQKAEKSKKFLTRLAAFVSYGETLDEKSMDEKLEKDGINTKLFSSEFQDFFKKTVKNDDHGIKEEQPSWLEKLAGSVSLHKKWAFSGVAALILAMGAVKFATPAVSAEAVLLRGAKIVKNLSAIHLKARMRTLERDNFELIGANYSFVDIEMWKKFTAPPKWRVEKPGRVVVMDGAASTLWIKNREAMKGGPNPGFVVWLMPLMDIGKVLEQEHQLAKEQNSRLSLKKEHNYNSAEKFVVTVEAKAQGSYESDWCKNTSVTESDNRREYLFDAETKHLEGLRVYIHERDKDVLVFEITEIIYNEQLDDSLFKFTLPKDIVWSHPIETLPDNVKYEKMSPEETVRAFFTACGEENWLEAEKMYHPVDKDGREIYGGAKIITIGKAFKSGLYRGVFVPYEIQLKNGYIKKWNLAVRNDNASKRYVVDGGF